jgi:hypothetical protein
LTSGKIKPEDFDKTVWKEYDNGIKGCAYKWGGITFRFNKNGILEYLIVNQHSFKTVLAFGPSANGKFHTFPMTEEELFEVKQGGCKHHCFEHLSMKKCFQTRTILTGFTGSTGCI